MVTTRRGVVASPPASPSGRAASNTNSSSSSPSRTPPFLPTPLERVLLAAFPAILIFGTLFSVLNPQTRGSVYDPAAQAYVQDPTLSPSYFARKSNLFNVLFVKRGWAWVTVSFFAWLFTHPAAGGSPGALTAQRARAVVRWAVITGWWVLVTQWCFGPPLIDRGFRWTGGKCEVAEREVAAEEADLGDVFTAVACKAAGGRWSGGHDISGHVFMLVLGTVFLAMEAGWPLWRANGGREERCVVMADGAIKSASVESDDAFKAARSDDESRRLLGPGGKFVAGVGGLNVWMLLMTAIYFHTWFEKVKFLGPYRLSFMGAFANKIKLTGLVTAAIGAYAVYYLPRFVLPLRSYLGIPGI